MIANCASKSSLRWPRNRSPAAESVFEVAAALDYEQRRRDMLKRLAAGGAVLHRCEPRTLGVELVKRYTVLKRTGAI